MVIVGSHISPKAAKGRPSGIQGRGLFAREPIRADSCDPNVGFAGNIVLVAMRDIAAGEELTTDYALFDDHDEVMACRCGRHRCRGTISGQDWRRPELQQRYGRYFSWYLLRRFQPAAGEGPAT